MKPISKELKAMAKKQLKFGNQTYGDLTFALCQNTLDTFNDRLEKCGMFNKQGKHDLKSAIQVIENFRDNYTMQIWAKLNNKKPIEYMAEMNMSDELMAELNALDTEQWQSLYGSAKGEVNFIFQ